MIIANGPIRSELLAALTQTSEVTAIVKGVADVICRDAQALAPVRTGDLRSNIKVQRVVDRATGRVSCIVGWGSKAWYGPMVEAGNENAAPRPHLVPAAIKNGAVAAPPGESTLPGEE